MNRIGSVIREKREAKGYTQEKLAEQIGRSTGYIGQVERGEIYPSTQILAKFVEVLGIDANMLFYDKAQTPYVFSEIAIRTARLSPEKQEFLLGVIELLEHSFKKDS